MLYVNGCSMCWGEELVPKLMMREADLDPDVRDRRRAIQNTLSGNPDTYNSHDVPLCRTEAQDEYRISMSWGGQLAKMLRTKVINDSCPGSSNHRIVRTTVDHLCSHQNISLVVIGWSHSARAEHWDNRRNRWIQRLPSEVDWLKGERLDMAKRYWKLTLNRYAAVDEYLRGVILLQSFLQARRIPYLFFNGISPIDPDIDRGVFQHLTDQISKRRYLRRDTPEWNCFQAWAIQNGFPLGPERHPLEEGHLEWAKYLHKYIHVHDILCADD